MIDNVERRLLEHWRSVREENQIEQRFLRLVEKDYRGSAGRPGRGGERHLRVAVPSNVVRLDVLR